jgi:hypothetical protein
MLRPGARPPQLRPVFGDLLACHRHLQTLGFRLVEKRTFHGGPRLEDGRPMSPILVWRNERVIVRIKPRGEPATGRFRAGLAHMSVCLVDGAVGAGGSLDTSWRAEVAKFAADGQLVARSPQGAATVREAPPWLTRSAEETWSDDTHFQFPDLVCDDRDIDMLIVPPR